MQDVSLFDKIDENNERSKEVKRHLTWKTFSHLFFFTLLGAIASYIVAASLKNNNGQLSWKGLFSPSVYELFISFLGGLLISLAFTSFRMLRDYYYNREENKIFFNDIISKLIGINILTSLSDSEFSSFNLNVKLLNFYHDQVFAKIRDMSGDYGGGYVIHNTNKTTQYREILEAGLKNSIKSFYAVLIGDSNLPHKRFAVQKRSEGLTSQNVNSVIDYNNYLAFINNRAEQNGISAIRLYIYERDELLNSFKEFGEEDLIKFFCDNQSHTKLFWIAPENIKELLGENKAKRIMDSYKKSDFAIIDETFIIKKDFEQKKGEDNGTAYNVEVLLVNHNKLYMCLFDLLNLDIRNTKRNEINMRKINISDSDGYRCFNSISTFEKEILEFFDMNSGNIKKIKKFFRGQRKMIGINK